MRNGPRRRPVAVLAVAFVVALAVLPGLAAADARAGGTVIVAEGETVDGGLQATGGTVIVHGTVDGGLQVAGGSVLIDGTVNGPVEVVAGNVRIDGRIRGDVSATGGNVLVDRNAVVEGDLDAAAGNVVVGGVVGGDARLSAGSVILMPSASVRGDVEYAVGDDGRFDDRGAAVSGTVTRVEDVSPDVVQFRGPPASILAAFGFVVNLLLGGLLLLVAPEFSAGVASRVTTKPVRMGAIGLLTLIAVPIALFVLAITIIGLPFALAAAVLFGLTLWVASVYGRFAIGTWLVGFAGVDDRWIALVVGLVVIGVLSRVPWIGWLFAGVAVLLGLGAIAAIAAGRIRDRRSSLG